MSQRSVGVCRGYATRSAVRTFIFSIGPKRIYLQISSRAYSRVSCGSDTDLFMGFRVLGSKVLLFRVWLQRCGCLRHLCLWDCRGCVTGLLIGSL